MTKSEVGETGRLHALQRLVDDLYVLFTSDSKEIAQRFGESRITSDSARVNYALELLTGSVSAALREAGQDKS